MIKHLDVLADAGLVTRTRAGRTVVCRLVPRPMNEARAWLDRHTRFWNQRVDKLVSLVESPGDAMARRDRAADKELP